MVVHGHKFAIRFCSFLPHDDITDERLYELKMSRCSLKIRETAVGVESKKLIKRGARAWPYMWLQAVASTLSSRVHGRQHDARLYLRTSGVRCRHSSTSNIHSYFTLRVVTSTLAADLSGFVQWNEHCRGAPNCLRGQATALKVTF